jgi:hypothetical protein
MTLRELFQKMDSREFAMWRAAHTYYMPIGGEWEQTATIAAQCSHRIAAKGQTPDPEDFIPVSERSRSTERRFKTRYGEWLQT